MNKAKIDPSLMTAIASTSDITPHTIWVTYSDGGVLRHTHQAEKDIYLLSDEMDVVWISLEQPKKQRKVLRKPLKRPEGT